MHAPAPNRVFIDAEGTQHDPDFISHLFPVSPAELVARRRANGTKARRLSQTGLFQESDSDSDMDSDDELAMPPPMNHFASDPFAYRSTRRTASISSTIAVAKSSPFPATPATRPPSAYRRTYLPPLSTSANTSYSYSPSPRSWQHTASLLDTSDCGHDESGSPMLTSACDRWSLKKRRKTSAASATRAVEVEQAEQEKPRRLLRKRWPDVVDEEGNEDEHASQPQRSEEVEDPEECAPTCFQALREQWQTIYLRFTLGRHRAARRLLPKRREENPFNEKFGT